MINLRNRDEKGFTLIEVLIALLISVIIGGSLFMVHKYHQKQFRKHEVISDLQQDLRAGMYIMESEIRMAGLDPLGSAYPQILIADSQNFRFQLDRNCNGYWFDNSNGNPNGNPNQAASTTSGGNDDNEEIQYGYSTNTDSFGLYQLARESWHSNMQPIIENIEILDFRYFDENGTLLNQDTDSDPTTADPVVGNLQSIRAVEITLVSRSDREYQGQNDTRAYSNLSNMVLLNANDHYFRKTLSKRILLRNM